MLNPSWHINCFSLTFSIHSDRELSGGCVQETKRRSKAAAKDLVGNCHPCDTFWGRSGVEVDAIGRSDRYRQNNFLGVFNKRQSSTFAHHSCRIRWRYSCACPHNSFDPSYGACIRSLAWVCLFICRLFLRLCGNVCCRLFFRTGFHPANYRI